MIGAAKAIVRTCVSELKTYLTVTDNDIFYLQQQKLYERSVGLILS